jgi:hypothetical protein
MNQDKMVEVLFFAKFVSQRNCPEDKVLVADRMTLFSTKKKEVNQKFLDWVQEERKKIEKTE